MMTSERGTDVIVTLGTWGLGLCRILQTNFGELTFRNCPKRAPEGVARYSTEHEKSIQNRPLRCRMVL